MSTIYLFFYIYATELRLCEHDCVVVKFRDKATTWSQPAAKFVVGNCTKKNFEVIL